MVPFLPGNVLWIRSPDTEAEQRVPPGLHSNPFHEVLESQVNKNALDWQTDVRFKDSSKLPAKPPLNRTTVTNRVVPTPPRVPQVQMYILLQTASAWRCTNVSSPLTVLWQKADFTPSHFKRCRGQGWQWASEVVSSCLISGMAGVMASIVTLKCQTQRASCCFFSFSPEPWPCASQASFLPLSYLPRLVLFLCLQF